MCGLKAKDTCLWVVQRGEQSLTLVPLWPALGPNLIDAFSKLVITVYVQCVCGSHRTTLGSPFSPSTFR